MIFDPIDLLSGANRRVQARSCLGFARSVGFEPEDWQLQVLESTANQIHMNCCRGAGKSALVGVLALRQLVTNRDFEILVLSRSDDAAMELVYHLRRKYELLPGAPRAIKKNDHELWLENGARLTSVACDDDTPRGYHVNLMIEDEASFVPHAVYMAARPTVQAKKGRYLMLSTPKGKAGHFWNVADQQTDWLKIVSTWRDQKRWDSEQLARIERERVEMGDDWFRQEYECDDWTQECMGCCSHQCYGQFDAGENVLNLTCCSPPGDACLQDTDCCHADAGSNAVKCNLLESCLPDGGYCSSEGLLGACCVTSGNACSSASDCCSGNCASGVCTGNC